jgi:hypothetical protein
MVLVSVGRSLYMLGMSLLVVFFVLIALIGALSPLGVSLPAELATSVFTTIGFVSLVSGLTILAEYLRWFQHLRPFDVFRVGSLGLSTVLGVLASSAILVPINAVIDIYSGYAPQPIPAVLLTLKAILTTVVTVPITLYVVARTSGVPLE